MSPTTFAQLTGVIDLTTGAGYLVNAYQGIRLTMIPGGGGTVRYSKVDEADATAHDPATQTDITTETTIDVDWPFYYVTAQSGTARIALV